MRDPTHPTTRNKYFHLPRMQHTDEILEASSYSFELQHPKISKNWTWIVPKFPQICLKHLTAGQVAKQLAPCQMLCNLTYSMIETDPISFNLEALGVTQLHTVARVHQQSPTWAIYNKTTQERNEQRATPTHNQKLSSGLALKRIISVSKGILLTPVSLHIYWYI